MTNEEAITQLGLDHYLLRSEINEKEMRPTTKEDLEEFNIAIHAIEENLELKAEIEQLKAELEHVMSIIPKMCVTCEYEDEAPWEQHCLKCSKHTNWKMKSKVSNE